MPLSERIQVIVSTFMSMSLLLALGYSLIVGNWFNAFLAGLAFVLTYIPALIERNYRITLPIEFEVITVGFMYASIYLGSIHGYYTSYWWWDVFLHTSSGVILGLVGFVMIYILNAEQRFRFSLSPRFVGIFTFVFALALGTVWEIFEFFLDFFGSYSMQAGLVDTMSDLIVDAIGALLVAIIGGFYVANVRVPLFDQLMKKFMQKNPRLFRRLLSRKK